LFAGRASGLNGGQDGGTKRIDDGARAGSVARMKKLLSILSLTFLVSVAAHGQAMANHYGTFTETRGTATPTNGTVALTVLYPSLIYIRVNYLDVMVGTFTEKLGVRTFNVMTSSNQWKGTIKSGVVRGTFKQYANGISGTFECPVQP
jgi:hypothetical protein